MTHPQDARDPSTAALSFTPLQDHTPPHFPTISIAPLQDLPLLSLTRHFDCTAAKSSPSLTYPLFRLHCCKIFPLSHFPAISIALLQDLSLSHFLTIPIALLQDLSPLSLTRYFDCTAARSYSPSQTKTTRSHCYRINSLAPFQENNKIAPDPRVGIGALRRPCSHIRLHLTYETHQVHPQPESAPPVQHPGLAVYQLLPSTSFPLHARSAARWCRSQHVVYPV